MNLQLHSSSGTHDNNIVGLKSSSRKIETTDFYSFGQLLAYSYYFGFQDIHKDNLLITNTGIQVIDLEQAFSQLLLPNQTLLLPANKNITWSAGLNILTNQKIDKLASPESKALIDGFVEFSELILRNIEEIRLILAREISNFEKHPIRIFFRATKDYVDQLNGISTATNWFPEESEQLARGDVPYFFISLENQKAQYYSSADWIQKEVQTPDEFKKFSDYCGKNPLDIITRQNIANQWAKGMLFLVKKMTSLIAKDTKWDTCSVSQFDGQLIFNSDEISMTAKL